MKRPRREEREVLFGVHPVLEALAAGKRTLERIFVAREGSAPGLGRLLRLAREQGVPISHVPRDVLARKAGARAVHQGVGAVVSAVPYADPSDIVRTAETAGGILLVLDGVSDPGNLGGTLRSAAGAGVCGVLLGEEGTVGLTPAVAKASAGAVERVPVAREPRLGSRLESLKNKGFRVVALDPRGTVSWDRTDLGGRLVVLAGGEERGLRKGLVGCADARVAIPLEWGMESLNVSVAVAVILFEAVRQRRLAAGWQGSPQEVPCQPLETRKPR